MYILRLLAILIAIAVVVCLGISLFTGDVRYRQLALKLLQFAVILALGVFGLMILERVAVIPI